MRQSRKRLAGGKWIPGIAVQLTLQAPGWPEMDSRYSCAAEPQAPGCGRVDSHYSAGHVSSKASLFRFAAFAAYRNKQMTRSVSKLPSGSTAYFCARLIASTVNIK